MEYGNQFFKFCFLLFLFPRCLLTDLVYWVKRELKTIKKKVHWFWFISLLLPGDQAKHQACWEGHNVKQHYPPKASASNLQCKVTVLVRHKERQAAFCSMEVNSSQGLPIPAKMYVSGQAEVLTHTDNYAPRPVLVLWSANPRFTPLSSPYTYHTSRKMNLCSPLQNLGSSSNF